MQLEISGARKRTGTVNKMTKIGFIGTGNMGGALAHAVAAAEGTHQLLLANRSPEKAAAVAAETGGTAVDNAVAAAEADYLFLGVKPQMYPEVLGSLAPVLQSRGGSCVLISMAAGVSIARVQELLGDGAERCHIIRIMPNTPVSIGEGVILYACGADVTAAEEQAVLHLLSKAGRLSALPESLIDAGSAVSGCGPAFVDLFVEALADGGVACGLPRRAALEYAAQMTVGAAKLILETGAHPGALKDAVCSPAGSTIAGVRTLETAALRAAVMNAVIAAYERTKALG